MKVVITGANSYIGNNLQTYIQENDGNMEVFQLDVARDDWIQFDFSNYDVVVHVAAIVHRKDIDSWTEYEKVNINLTVEIAQKAKIQGVKQFVFLSSMAVYGIDKALSSGKGTISNQTELKPSSMYGKSKYIAEQKLMALESEDFKIAVVRPPNVYGPGCRGGYISTYVSVVSKLPVIPKAFTSVKQSLLYIDNLSCFIYLLIIHQKNGIYTPQDDTSVSAVELMQYISEGLNLNKKTSFFLGLFVHLLAFCPLVKKGYGGVSYIQTESHHEEFDYLIVPFKEGIKRTVSYGTQRDNSGI